MEVCIKSHREAWAMIQEKRKFYNVIYVAEPEKPFYGQTKEIIQGAKKALVCVFHDIESPVLGKMMPSQAMIQKVIEFAEKNKDIIVCCSGGISRSAALGYIVAVLKHYSVEDAIKVLDPDKHVPNFLVIQIAAELLKKPDMIGFIRRFREQVFSTMS